MEDFQAKKNAKDIEHKALVEEYEKRLIDQKLFCSLKLVNPATNPVGVELPIEVKISRLLYLSYGRNAWHTTWINRYYPGSISFFDRDLREMAERNRVQGSQFRISSRDALILRFSTDTLIVVSINDRPIQSYSTVLDGVLPFQLGQFWNSSFFQIPNWLLMFKISGWRPDLFPTNSHGMFAEPNGSKSTLSWTAQSKHEKSEGIRLMVDSFMPRMLRLSSIPLTSPQSKSPASPHGSPL